MRQLLALILVACAAAANAAPKANGTLSQKEWLAQFTENFQATFCAREQALQMCLNLSAKQCRTDVVAQAKACVKELALPKRIEVGAPAAQAGAKIGRCVARAAIEKSKAKQTEPTSTPRPECSDVESLP